MLDRKTQQPHTKHRSRLTFIDFRINLWLSNKESKWKWFFENNVNEQWNKVTWLTFIENLWQTDIDTSCYNDFQIPLFLDDSAYAFSGK